MRSLALALLLAALAALSASPAAFAQEEGCPEYGPLTNCDGSQHVEPPPEPDASSAPVAAPLYTGILRARAITRRVRARKCLPRITYQWAPAREVPIVARAWTLRVNRLQALQAMRAGYHRCIPPDPKAPPATIRLAYKVAVARGWASQFWAIRILWQRESQWHACRHYPSTTNCSYTGDRACGLPQFVPCSKLLDGCLPDGRRAPTLGACPTIVQIRKGYNYIEGRYGSPTAALAHSNAVGWY